MKIEKISDNQIRCTLSHQDLADREIKISELAYGTEKAKALFRDMMQQASFEFGFEAEDIPIMIEAIPISRETLILIITKVEDPDELDTRFSKFSSEKNDNDEYFEDTQDFAEQLLDKFNEIADMIEEAEIEFESNSDKDNTESSANNKHEDNEEPSADNATPVNFTKVFSFSSLNEITRFASNVIGLYDGINTIYKDTQSSIYYLTLQSMGCSSEEFSRVCNIASEYGVSERTTYATTLHFQEHFEVIIKDNAVQILGNL